MGSALDEVDRMKWKWRHAEIRVLLQSESTDETECTENHQETETRVYRSLSRTLDCGELYWRVWDETRSDWWA